MTTIIKGINCDTCNDEKEDCQECCDHMDLDHGVCLDCGADLTDDLANRAYEQSEGMER